MDERERIARLVAGSLTAGKENMIVSFGVPAQVMPGVYVVPAKEFRAPLWSLYTPAADAVIADQERQAEAARARYAAAAIMDDD